MGAIAGQAWIRENELHLSPHFLAQQGSVFVNDTPIHEAAHFIAARIFGEHGHGGMWIAVMRSLGVVNVTRCHNFHVANAPRETRKRAVYNRLLEEL